MVEESSSNWMPLESNPEVINEFIKELGFDTSKYKMHDVLSTDDWAQEMVPRPVKAVFFLYPISQVQEDFRKKENELITTTGQVVDDKVAISFQMDIIMSSLAVLYEAIRWKCLRNRGGVPRDGKPRSKGGCDQTRRLHR